ncbi:speriolin-like [Haliotis rufescens]|uniref:speriolin-like n=1 Tax=Haliotis rufescens TaxID=6454 RepID=UPI00201F7E61|nr:speriolin-like [Haliotis rufescens]
MSFGEHNSSLHASDLVPAGRTSPRGVGADEGSRESRYLRLENEQLRQCLRLMQEQAELESANLISSVIAWCDDRFRKKFADMSLATSTGRKSASPFRPITPPGPNKAPGTDSKISSSDYVSTGSTFSNLTPPSSPVRGFNKRTEEIDRSYPTANTLLQEVQPPQPSLSNERSYSPTLSSSRQRQTSPAVKLFSDATPGLASTSGRSSPVGIAISQQPSRASSRVSSPNSIISSTLQETPARGSDIQADVPEQPPPYQFNPALRQYSVKLPTESDVAAAFMSQFSGRSDFSGTLETHDLSSTRASLKRPESAPFVPYVHESGYPGQQSHTSPNPSLIQSAPQRGQSPRGMRPPDSPQHHLVQNHSPRSPSPTQGRYSPRGQTVQNTASIPQGQSTAMKSPSPGLSYSAHPTLPVNSVVVHEDVGRERTLTPIPEMQKTVPRYMSNIVEEMEEELKGLSSRSMSPADMISNSQKYGLPKAESTPKKGRTSSPTAHSGSKRYNSSLRSPRGSRTPSPVSDDSSTVPVRRHTTFVKPSYRILGEIAFQLERRILDYVFSRNKIHDGDRAKRRFYGYTVSNIPFMIAKEVQRYDGTTDDQLQFKLNYRLRYTVITLGPYGYKLERHGNFAQEMINKYGLLSNAPDRRTLDAFGLVDAETLRGFVSLLSQTETEKRDNLILLECLMLMAHDDGRAIFLW